MSDYDPQHRESMLTTLLRKLYLQKIVTLALCLLLLALVCLSGSYFLEEHKELVRPWVLYVPFHSLGDACFVAAMVGFVYEWIVRKESEKRLEEAFADIFRARIAEAYDKFRIALLTDPKLIARTLKPAERKDVIEAVLQAETGSDELGRELYQASISRIATYKERWENYRCSAMLATISDASLSLDVRDIYYHCYYDISYTTTLSARKLTFTCVSTIEEYNARLADRDCEMCWLFPTPAGSPPYDESAFAVSAVRVGSLPVRLTRTLAADGGVLYTGDHVEFAKLVGKRVKIEYRIDVRVKRRGHLLTLNFVYPTKSIFMEIDISNTDIGHIEARDFFASGTKPAIRYVPSATSPRKISVEVDGWVFPKGGVDFVWTLASERRTL